MTWSRHLFLFYFLKGKQNKKENPKRDSLFWKRWSVKNRIGLGGQVTYREGMVKTVDSSLAVAVAVAMAPFDSRFDPRQRRHLIRAQLVSQLIRVQLVLLD